MRIRALLAVLAVAVLAACSSPTAPTAPNAALMQPDTELGFGSPAIGTGL
jgi:outer membrane biogenesis lipoprotein LolB